MIGTQLQARDLKDQIINASPYRDLGLVCHLDRRVERLLFELR